MAVRISGADQLFALRQRVKDAGDKDIWKAFTKEVREVGKPVIADAKRNAKSDLPSGYAKVAMRGVRFSTTVRTGSGTAGVQIRAVSGRKIEELDRGRLKHPLFGDRDHWFEQRVKPGWWTRATVGHSWRAFVAVDKAMSAVARKIVGR